MSKAVEFALKILESIDKKLVEVSSSYDDGFYYSLDGLFSALDIRQGDYKVCLVREGLAVKYLIRSTKEKPSKNSKQNEHSRFKKEEYVKDRLELLEYALGKHRYLIKVRDYGKEYLEKAEKELSSMPPEARELNKRLCELIPPVFEIYLKSTGELLGIFHEILGNYFILKLPVHPEALYVMKRIGKHIFECRDGKLEVNFNPIYYGGIKSLEEWIKELRNYKK
jgi:hypothetical protein